MNAGMESFQNFIGDKHFFTIPVYQRKYDWKQIHCQQLFDDILKIIKNDKPHFLGTFVYQRKQIIGNNSFDEYIIIDGQQRITSLILLAKALYTSMNDADDKEDILYKYIKHQSGKGIKNKCKLKPTEYDRNIFEKIMIYDDFSENTFDENEKSSVIYKNFLFFKEKISKCEYSAEKIYEVIPLLNIVWINIDDGENPQEIFESLNSTGLYLTQSDLIRNYLLMPLNYEIQQNFYKKYWLEIEKLLRTSDNIEEFLVQYLITKRKSNSLAINGKNVHLTKNILYYSFKRYFEDNFLEKVEIFLQDICRYARFYNKFIFDEDTNFDKLSALEKKFYELIYQLESTTAPIILMYLYDKYEKNIIDEQIFINFTNALISLSFRSKICKSAGITGQFAGNVIAKLDKEKFLDEDAFWSAITFGKGKYTFPSDETFQKSLRNDDLYLILRSAGCKYLLYTLEKNSPQAKEVSRDDKATVEHILPQRLNANWKNYLETRNDLQAHEILLHKLGNLTLSAYNSEISNSDFETKKKFYAESGFFYTRELKTFTDWTSAQIQIRSKKLANEALKIWILPEKYNSATVEVGNIFTLNSDSGIFTGKKPALLSISNVEKEIKNWRDFLREIIKMLCTIDKNIFKEIIQMDNVPRGKKLFSANPENVYGPLQIDENFYVAYKYDFDTETTFKIAKILVENFDYVCGTNFKEEIWFTLKN